MVESISEKEALEGMVCSPGFRGSVHGVAAQSVSVVEQMHGFDDGRSLFFCSAQCSFLLPLEQPHSFGNSYGNCNSSMSFQQGESRFLKE